MSVSNNNGPFSPSVVTPLLKIEWEPFRSRGLSFYLKREDLVDAECSGNKAYKLHYHLEAAQARGCNCLLSFGGAYSNHIHALAAAGKRHNLSTIGVIRGARPAVLSPTLQDAQRWGMKLHFIERGEYRDKNSPLMYEALQREFGNFYLIPEGGGGYLGALGCQAIAAEIVRQAPEPVHLVCVPCGTGATLAGIASALPAGMAAAGFSVLKGEGDLALQIDALLRELGATDASWQLYTEFHCGGYARLPANLKAFMQAFEAQTGIPLDPVYTAKMLWGLTQLARAQTFPAGTCIVAVHTGGLQGRRGFDLKEKTGTTDGHG